jgi:hypothetical protein
MTCMSLIVYVFAMIFVDRYRFNFRLGWVGSMVACLWVGFGSDVVS